MQRKTTGRFGAAFLGLVTVWLSVVAAPADAATLYVDAANDTGVEDGTEAHPYRSIQTAVDQAASCDTISVAPGTYSGGVNIDGKCLRLLGRDPATTTIRGAGPVISAFGAFPPGADMVEIGGFSITGGTYGVRFSGTTVRGHVHNCLIVGNGTGVYTGADTRANVYNNVIDGNDNGLWAYTSHDAGISSSSNIFVSNNIALRATDAVVSSSRDNFFGNTVISSGEGGAGYGAPNLAGDTHHDPRFVDAGGTSDYHLCLGPDPDPMKLCADRSPSIDAGSPLPADTDCDGTRNDQGAYGGPGAAGFCPSPQGSPIVLDLTVTPHDVPLGGTLTVRAKGRAR